MKSEYRTVIATFIAAMITIASAASSIFFISHFGVLILGLILGAVVQKRNMELEKWARDKIKAVRV